MNRSLRSELRTADMSAGSRTSRASFQRPCFTYKLAKADVRIKRRLLGERLARCSARWNAAVLDT
jgi:hypothetical protein